MIYEDGNPLFGIAQEELDVVLDTAPEAIPVIVPAIYRQIRVVTQNQSHMDIVIKKQRSLPTAGE